MEQLDSIRKYYSPLQPSVKSDEEHVEYIEISPTSELRNYIHCYWQLKTNKALHNPYNYRVVSDGCVDIFFDLKKTEDSFVMGFCKKYTEFSIGKEFNFGGIRFFPSIFPLLFGQSAKQFSGKAQPLDQILPGLSEYISTHIKKDFTESVPKLNDFFCNIIKQNNSFPDDRFYQAFLSILKRNGNLETENELNTGLSPRQLRRLFNYYIGTTPKSFSQVVRFQYVLNAKPSSQSLKENKIFYDVGFFDQAHFIKNFTQYYGVTPSRAFR